MMIDAGPSPEIAQVARKFRQARTGTHDHDWAVCLPQLCSPSTSPKRMPMTSPSEISKIVELEDLPSPPAVAAKLLEIFSDPSLKVLDLVKTLSVDPTLSARIIAYANSPTISVRREVAHLKQAVVVLGMRMVKTIALSFSIVEASKGKTAEGMDLDEFWRESLVRAVAAKNICSFASQDSDMGFLSGLMMEIGQLAVAFSPLEKEEITEQFPEFRVVQSFELQEDAELDQYRMGALLLKKWMFPHDIVQAIGSICQEQKTTDLQKALMLSSGLGKLVCREQVDPEHIEKVKQFAQEEFSIGADLFESIYLSIVEEWREYAQLLQFDSTTRSLAEIETAAKKQIASMSMAIHHENLAVSEENEYLRHQAKQDGLTGLWNRRSWQEKSEVERERAFRTSSPFSIMICDIDHFKQVNDRYGHQVGDQVLTHLSKTLLENIRKYDDAFRIGGEEFVMLLPNCDLSTASIIAERLREAIAGSPLDIKGKDLYVTVSIGVSSWTPEANPSIEELFRIADRRLYMAKRSGRNKVCISDKAPEEILDQQANSLGPIHALDTNLPNTTGGSASSTPAT